MKNIIYIFLMLILTTSLTAQDQYAQGMKKAFDLWGENKVMEASGVFERIAQVEKDNWLPSYYAANSLIVASFGSKDKALINEMLEKAKGFIVESHERSPENAEVYTMEGLLYTAYVAMEPETYGMMYSNKIMGLHQKAIEIDGENPRAQLNSIEYEIGGARFFNTELSTFCDRIEQVRPLFENQKKPTDFSPSYGIERLEASLKECGCK